MDTAVGLVDTYLRVNGYFTVTEYPVIAAQRRGASHRMVTDLDMLAVRFPGAGRWVLGREDKSGAHGVLLPPDPALQVVRDQTDMIIGEVKEGRADINQALRNPSVLEATLIRFGCCADHQVSNVVDALLQKGHARTHGGHHVRLVAFGSSPGKQSNPRHTTISLGHVTTFLHDYINEHWDVLHHADFKDPVFGFLLLMAKAGHMSRATSGEEQG